MSFKVMAEDEPCDDGAGASPRLSNAVAEEEEHCDDHVGTHLRDRGVPA